MRLLTRCGLWMLACSGLLVVAANAVAADSTGTTTAPPATPQAQTAAVSDVDKLQFTQQNAQSQMVELQDRMFHLAELTKEREPDDSTRLLLAVRKAREQLIVEQMKEVLAELSTKDMQHVSVDTTAVVAKLEELKKLLVATDLEMQLQLERLKKLQLAIKQLDQAIKDEKNQQLSSAKLADLVAKGQSVKSDSLKQAKDVQADNRKKTDQITNAVKDLGKLEKVEQNLGAGSQSMSTAEGSLGSGKPGDASLSQTDATKKLETARAQLEQERQNIIEDLAKQVKRVVMENLQEMIERQTAVRQTTEGLSGRLATERQALMQLKQLAPAEEHIIAICDQTADLVIETEFSVALPPALESLDRRMGYIMGDLTGGKGDQTVVTTELGVERDLKDLLETFKDLSPTSQSTGQCKGCKGDMNKLLAELKVIRMMQSRVNENTVDLDGRRAEALAYLPADMREKIGKLSDDQRAVRDAMDRLHERFGSTPPPADAGDKK